MRFLVALCAVAIVACSGGGAPGRPPTPAGPLPSMYDLSLVPERPQFVLRGTPDKAEPPDTNDANIYYNAGLGAMFWNPAKASAAFYWASRLVPGWADPYFARWYLLRNTGRVLPDSVGKRVDSLVLIASLHDPFFDERLAMQAFSAQVHTRFSIAQHEIKSAVDAENLRRGGSGAPLLVASRLRIPHTWYLAYAERHFDSASRDLAHEIKKHPDALALYIYRAKAQYYLKQFDSAATTLAAAIGRVDTKDTSRLLPVYFSREMFYYAMGMARNDAKEDSAARVAFQNTVTENLGFYMAHLHLASQALVSAIPRPPSTKRVSPCRFARRILSRSSSLATRCSRPTVQPMRSIRCARRSPTIPTSRSRIFTWGQPAKPRMTRLDLATDIVISSRTRPEVTRCARQPNARSRDWAAHDGI